MLYEVITPLHHIDVGRSIGDALAAMSTHRVRHMLVQDSAGRGIGIVSQLHLFERLALQDMESALTRLREERDRLLLQTQLDLALSAAGAGLV